MWSNFLHAKLYEMGKEQRKGFGLAAGDDPASPMPSFLYSFWAENFSMVLETWK